MSLTLRLILIAGSFITFLLCVKKIKESKLKVTNSVIWISGSILLIIMSIFSDVVSDISKYLGFMAPVNFIFLIIILFLLVQSFMYNIRIATLNEKIKDLNHYIALKEKSVEEIKIE